MVQKIILLIICGIYFSCSNQEAGKLSAEEKYILDTMYSNNLSKVRTLADSLCVMKRDSFYQIASDSIKKARIEEIELLTGNKEVFNIIEQ